MQENPVISDWVPSSGGSTEGLLGGRLAQRLAALRGMLAAGARWGLSIGLTCVPVSYRAPCVPKKTFFGKSELLVIRRVLQARCPLWEQYGIESTKYCQASITEIVIAPAADFTQIVN
jgi:hypothetical protein